MSKAELEILYTGHLDAVEAGQKQLEAILRELAARNASVPVYLEGWTDARVNDFRQQAAALSGAGAKQLDESRRSLAEVKKQTGPGAAEMAKAYEALIAHQRLEWLKLGAAAVPSAEELVEARALEDANALQKASPRWLGGELFDPASVQAREDAMARRLAAAKEPLVVVLLAGEHDLRETLSRHAPRARYVRITTNAYREASAGR